MTIFFIIIVAVVFIILAIYAFTSTDDSDPNNSSQQFETKTNVYEKNSQAINNWRFQRKLEYENWISNMQNSYGRIDVIVPIVPSETQRTLLVFKEKQKLYFSSSWLRFNDIISCQLTDNPKVVNGPIIATTKGDVWNEIKRFSMQKSFGKTTGTWLAGPEKFTTEYTRKPDKVYHNYSIIINTKDISKPLFEIKVGEDGRIAQQIYSIILAIISTQKK